VRTAVPIVRAVLRRGPLLLCYHSVGSSPRADDPEFLRVEPGRFRAQLELVLAAGGRFATVAEIADRVRARAPLGGLACATFDDGYEDNLAVALPILRELGLTATVFVATALAGRPSPWMRPGSGVRMMDAGELRELAAAGVELGGHTVTHPDLTAVDAATCRREVRDGRRELEAMLGRPVTSFAYPFFRFDDVARAAVRDAGYAAAVTGLGRGSASDPMLLPRALVGGKDGTASFLARIGGVYDPLFASGAGRAVRAATRPGRAVARALLERRPAPR
jgi:peptidoglycan/xylan/chitin deacetylase (PgdA/CDA1 family)